MMNVSPVRGVLLGMLLSLLCWSGQVRTAAASAALTRGASKQTMCGQQSCMRTMLAILNADRAARHVAPLRLQRVQADGKQGCAGSYGHSVAMATSGAIWHVNASFPGASFPHDLCVRYSAAGENVGESASGEVGSDLRQLDQVMMQEPHGAAVCAQETNHACNILNPAYHFVGIGVYVSGGTTWLTEDFTN